MDVSAAKTGAAPPSDAHSSIDEPEADAREGVEFTNGKLPRV